MDDNASKSCILDTSTVATLVKMITPRRASDISVYPMILREASPHYSSKLTPRIYSLPSFINAFKLFATPKLALAICCLIPLSPVFTPVPCASLNRSVSFTNSLRSPSPSALNEAGRALVETATMEDAMAITSDRCSFSTGGPDEVRMAARRFWIEFTNAEDWAFRYGYKRNQHMHVRTVLRVEN